MMNDYTVRLLAIDRVSTYEREAKEHRLAAQAKRTARTGAKGGPAAARPVDIRSILRRLALRPLQMRHGR